MADETAIEPAKKPGFRTSEFWLNVAAMVMTAVFSSGALTNSTALQIAGIVASILGALGYTVARTQAKKA